MNEKGTLGRIPDIETASDQFALIEAVNSLHRADAMKGEPYNPYSPHRLVLRQAGNHFRQRYRYALWTAPTKGHCNMLYRLEQSSRGGRFGRASYQRSPDRERSKLRRQTLAATSPLPPKLAAHLTPSQLAYARLLVDEHLRCGDHRLCLDEAGARTGSCAKTIQRAQYRLKQLKLIEVELRPNEGQKHDTNVVRIVSTEWLTWIAMGKIPKHIGGQKCLATANTLFLKKIIDELQQRRDAVDKPIQVDPVDPGLKAALDRYERAMRTAASRGGC